MAGNCTVDGQIHGSSYLHGDEIGLVWSEHIPLDQRRLNLTYDSGQNQLTFNRIKKKDEARIVVAQVPSSTPSYNRGYEENSVSDDFVIFVSCGGGGDRREGVQSIAARQVSCQETLIRQPQPAQSSLLIVPIRTFKQMVESFSKCKKQSIRLCFYTNNFYANGLEYRGRPGLMLTTDMVGGGKSGAILEKYGEVPDDDSGTTSPGLNISMNNLAIDENAIVRTNNTGFRLVLEEEKELGPNEFVFDADKVSIFNRLATMHNEGNVRIYYQPGCHLRIAHRFGGFGECELNLHNKHIKYQ